MHSGGPIGCGTARELISAAADGETRGVDDVLLRAHLDTCAACAAHDERVAVLARTTRLRSASSDHVFVARVLADAHPARLGRGGWLRPALAWCGVLIALQAVQPLVFGEVDGVSTHVARHVGASTLALAIGLLYAAWRPHRAFGLLPLVSALLLTTVAGAILDTVVGNTGGFAEAAHITELAGMVLLWMIAGSPGWDRVATMFSSWRREAVRSTN